MESIPSIPAGRTRIAPTPSGWLHFGNAFNFVLTEQLARSNGSRLLLRIDDLDAERKRPEYVSDIFATLEWLGIRPDEGPSGVEDFERNWSQELRQDRYLGLAARLKEQDVLYACSCSRSELQANGARGLPHECRSTTAVGNSVAWRLRVNPPCRVVMNEFSGRIQEVDLADYLSDPVLLQRDTGRPAYQLASLSDDIEMGVTFIVRGLDLLPSSLCQIHLADRLGLSSFQRSRFLHHPLQLGPEGQKLSKSAGGTRGTLRESGIHPHAIRDAVKRYLEGKDGHFIA